MRMLVLVALAIALSGCVNFGDRTDTVAITYYMLDDEAPVAAVRETAVDASVLQVLDTTVSGFYDSEAIVFSRAPGTRGQYQFARWTERPGKRFADLLRARLDAQGRWRIAGAGGFVRGDRLLDTELVEIYHDAALAPGSLRLVLRAELVDLRTRQLIDRRVFRQSVPLATYDAAGAARAANQAATRTLDELEAWLTSAR